MKTNLDQNVEKARILDWILNNQFIEIVETPSKGLGRRVYASLDDLRSAISNEKDILKKTK